MLQTYDAAIRGCGEAGVFDGAGGFSTGTPAARAITKRVQNKG